MRHLVGIHAESFPRLSAAFGPGVTRPRTAAIRSAQAGADALPRPIGSEARCYHGSIHERSFR